MVTPDDNELLRLYLADRSVSCPSCRYDVRDLTEQRCPECGEELCLRLEVRFPRLAEFATGLIGLSVCAGFGGIIIVLTVLLSGGPDGKIMTAIAVISVLAVIAIAAWVRGYRHLRRRASAVRWGLAALCWLFPLAQVLSVVILD